MRVVVVMGVGLAETAAAQRLSMAAESVTVMAALGRVRRCACSRPRYRELFDFCSDGVKEDYDRRGVIGLAE